MLPQGTQSAQPGTTASVSPAAWEILCPRAPASCAICPMPSMSGAASFAAAEALSCTKTWMHDSFSTKQHEAQESVLLFPAQRCACTLLSAQSSIKLRRLCGDLPIKPANLLNTFNLVGWSKSMHVADCRSDVINARGFLSGVPKVVGNLTFPWLCQPNKPGCTAQTVDTCPEPALKASLTCPSGSCNASQVRWPAAGAAEQYLTEALG